MEFRTKREAEEAVAAAEEQARVFGLRASWLRYARTDDKKQRRAGYESDAKMFAAEAARIRALLPTLPESV